jgi:bifunctional non-homologous end joining protein LigD
VAFSPARSRRPPPAGFIQPARPLLTTTTRSGPEWAHEIKHDGYRLIARKDAGRVVLWSRYATDYSDTFLRIAEAVRSLPIDGEAVVFRPDGHSDFMNRSRASYAFLCLLLETANIRVDQEQI